MPLLAPPPSSRFLKFLIPKSPRRSNGVTGQFIRGGWKVNSPWFQNELGSKWNLMTAFSIWLVLYGVHIHGMAPHISRLTYFVLFSQVHLLAVLANS